ncbi:MAG TPA: response regulator transcription factor [Candidatus Acidoferrum sp.]|nr:response regulator transcription factor [Candidatus Acidoferrum sp.]
MNSKSPRNGGMPDNLNEPTPEEPVAGAKRIFIIDDHAMFRDGLRRLIDLEPDLKVCGDASDGIEALRQMSNNPPDLVIVDISLDSTSGLDLIKSIKRDHEDMPVLVVSMHSESLYGDRALRAGAMGYVMKSEPATTVVAAIRKVLSGNVHISESMATLVVSKFVKGEPDQIPSPLEALSDRELEVFRMLGQGKGTREIAQEMKVAIPTISSFKNRIKEKLKFKNSTEMILFALQWFRQEPPEDRR